MTPTSKPGALTSQKAPSAKRCIKTGKREAHVAVEVLVRKHRAPKGALRRRDHRRDPQPSARRSESTERQKVH